MLRKLVVMVIIRMCWSLDGIVDINLVRHKCFEQSVPRIIRCQTTFQQRVWDSLKIRPIYLDINYIDGKDLAVVCCGLWDMVSCMRSSAIGWSDCPPEVLIPLTRDIENLRHRSDLKNCTKRFRQGSVTCEFPLWSVISIFLGSVLILIIINCCMHRS